MLGAEPPLSCSRIHDLFHQGRMPRTREQLEQLLGVLITANKFRLQESTAYAVLLKRGLALLQERGHRYHNGNTWESVCATTEGWLGLLQQAWPTPCSVQRPMFAYALGARALTRITPDLQHQNPSSRAARPIRTQSDALPHASSA